LGGLVVAERGDGPGVAKALDEPAKGNHMSKLHSQELTKKSWNVTVASRTFGETS
jgi:hypothetical protein